MKCIKCEQELPGAAVICRNCGFNNALQGIGEWRTKRTQVLTPRGTAPNARTSAHKTGDATLIRFPISTEKAAADEAAETLANGQLPAWRRQLHEKVRQVLEQRQVKATRSTHADEREADDVNPIVQAAISRIRRTTPQAISSSVITGGTTAQATARALAYEQQLALQPDSPTEPTTPALQQSHARSASLPELPRSVSPVPEQPVPTSDETASPLIRAAPKKTEIIPVSALTHAAQAAEAEKLSRPVAEAATVTESTSAVGEKSAAELSEAAADQVAPTTSNSESNALPTLTRGSSGKAPFLARGAAAIIDLEVIAFSFLPFFTAFTLFNAEFSRGSMYALAGLAMVMTFLYHLLTIRIAGRTFGMAVFRIRVADASSESEPLTFNQAVQRAGGAVVSLALIPLNLLVIALSAERQSLSDQFSGTTIVRQ